MSAVHDLRDAWRGLVHDRLYALTAIGTLALTLGAATAVFSIVNGVLLRPLQYPDPQALVSMREVVPGIVDRYPTLPVTPRHFDIWRNRATSFTSMAEMDWRTSTLTGAGDAVQLVVLRSSGTLFDVLQLPVALGRGLTRDDESADHPRVTVISDRLWRERFGADPGVLGKTATLGGTQYTIVGLLSAGTSLPELDSLGSSGTLNTKVGAIVPFRIKLDDFDWMGEFNYGVVARLKRGITLQQARAEMDVIQGAVAEIARRETHEAAELRGWVMPLEEQIVGSSRRALLLLLGAVIAVLLIACANLANLTLTRTVARLRDSAVRGALGASRWDLVRGVFVEQLALAVAGGVAGLLVARAAVRVFVTTAPVSLPRVSEVSIDLRAAFFALTITPMAAAIVALLPAIRLGRGNLEAVLRSGGRGADRGGQRVRGLLLAAQVALCVTLLAATALFVSSLSRLLNVDTGFTPEGAALVEIAPVSARYPDVAARAALYDRILERVDQVPAVSAASWTSALPLTGETWVDKIVRRDGPAPSEASSSANFRFVGPQYFRAIGMPLLHGRGFEQTDRKHTAVPAVLSERAAHLFWPNENPIGRHFTRSNPDQQFEIVGIVPDGHVTELDQQSPLMVYLPYWFNNEGKSVLVVRTRGDAAAVLPEIRQLVRGIDPEIAIARTAPLRDVVDAAVEGRRYQASLFTTFGAVALMIALLGVYATTAYGISKRRREMNIRVALGARASQVFALVLRQSTVPVLIGVGVGTAGALAIGDAIASQLFEVKPRDPGVLGGVALLMALAGAISAAVAARRGVRLDPAAALRDE
jgi:predicted permease